MSLDLDDRTVFRALLRICKPLGIGPTTSIEAEEYFRKLLISYEGSSIDAAFESWLEQELADAPDGPLKASLLKLGRAVMRHS